ncbi:MAG: T9SS type A sorting domain-containing protein, partial [Saprospiraceae bacterium]
DSRDTNGDGIPDIKEVSVKARDLDAGSNHPCGYSLKYSFSRDINDTVRTFGCADANQSVPVSLFVTDINGNWSECKARIFVQDDPSRLPHCTTNAMANVTGFIHSSNTEAMKSVEVILESTTTKSELSIDDGRYIFNDLPTNQNYIVRPVKNQDWLNGVTTADIVKIQKHILGIQEFKHANQYIAADVNNSNSITAKDISDLRKLILGVTAAIPSNTSWKFIDKQYSFDHPEDALLHQYPMSYTLKPLLSNMNIDFTGIKIGDVNESAIASGVAKVETRSSEKLIIDVEELTHTNDDEIILSFSARDIERYEGFQFTLHFNTDVLEFVGKQNNIESLVTDEQISFINTDAGIITCSWNGDSNSKNKLFELVFRKKKVSTIADQIVINSLLTPALALLNSTDQEQEVRLNFRSESQSVFSVKQNKPNPWNKTTDIEICVPEISVVNLKLYDFTGKLISTLEKKLAKGVSIWSLERSQFGHSGVYFYQFNCGSHSITQKMIVD